MKAVEVTLNIVVHVESLDRESVYEAFNEMCANEPSMVAEMLTFESLEPDEPAPKKAKK